MAKVSNATVRRTALRSPSLNMMRRRNCWTRLGAGPWMVWQLPTWAAAVCSAVLRGLPRPQCTLRSRTASGPLAQINRSINDILLRNPDYRTDLYDKYLSPSSNQVPVLTKEEVEYIELRMSRYIFLTTLRLPLSHIKMLKAS